MRLMKFLVNNIKKNAGRFIRPAFFFDIHSDMVYDISDLHTSDKSDPHGYRFRKVQVQLIDL